MLELCHRAGCAAGRSRAGDAAAAVPPSLLLCCCCRVAIAAVAAACRAAIAAVAASSYLCCRSCSQCVSAQSMHVIATVAIPAVAVIVEIVIVHRSSCHVVVAVIAIAVVVAVVQEHARDRTRMPQGKEGGAHASCYARGPARPAPRCRGRGVFVGPGPDGDLAGAAVTRRGTTDVSFLSLRVFRFVSPKMSRQKCRLSEACLRKMSPRQGHCGATAWIYGLARRQCKCTWPLGIYTTCRRTGSTKRPYWLRKIPPQQPTAPTASETRRASWDSWASPSPLPGPSPPQPKSPCCRTPTAGRRRRARPCPGCRPSRH